MENQIDPKEFELVLLKILDLGYNSLKALNNSVVQMNKQGFDKLTQEEKNRMDITANVMILLNDILAPAHEISKKLLKESELPFIEFCIGLAQKSQKIGEEIKAIHDAKKEDQGTENKAEVSN